MTSSAAPNKEITAPSDRPDPSRSLPLSAARQALVNDIIALYSCHPTRERILRYTPDCVYDDQFVHADDRYKVAGQWYALPQLFEASINEGYQVVRNDSKVIQFKIAQTWTFRMTAPDATVSRLATPTIAALVTLTLDPLTLQSDAMRVKYHREQPSEENYNRELMGFTFKKWQADQVAKHMDSPEIEAFRSDKGRTAIGYGDANGEVA